ncbi:hypothetical protein GCM10025868_03620 [Angustibacter aerolatus]|uniref:Uncharacterized protein n=1 Tax=Angustibacter aerolatus TaxID=1162965 RepID=A0ABQ6JDX7_9ACTN|nr:hypothetical protein GCM10025868_03620 [Angustibacter aerolatus]
MVEVGAREQVPHQAPASSPEPSIAVPASGLLIRTSSTPSSSRSSTSTRSPLDVGRFLPTWSARIGRLAVAAVDQHGEADGARAADVLQGVERGADGAPAVEDVVDQHDRAAVDAALGDLGALEGADRVRAQVVAVHRDVERAPGHLGALDVGDPAGQPLRERDAAARDAQQHQALGTAVVLDHLVGDAREHALDLRCLQHRAGSHRLRPPPRLTGRLSRRLTGRL